MPKLKEAELTLLPFLPSTAKEAKSYYKANTKKKHNAKKVMTLCFMCLMLAVGFVIGVIV